MHKKFIVTHFIYFNQLPSHLNLLLTTLVLLDAAGPSIPHTALHHHASLQTGSGLRQTGMGGSQLLLMGNVKLRIKSRGVAC